MRPLLPRRRGFLQWPLALGLVLLGLPACRAPAATSAPLNAVCPRSGSPVALDSLTFYRDRVVGFCNPHCRDDFATHVAERPQDRTFFDALLFQSP